ncbi:ATP-dependent DNA helicase MER3 [Coemansia erecta]|uniref:ATP-dependent DNA helicase MER3 n=1 Tax=Coemansia erecta TaxID=147472 RepID=A0A9W7Y0V8_9FUNG|nr:ATP-dependent DNA helicase MER3 [Coemansia erecta]
MTDAASEPEYIVVSQPLRLLNHAFAGITESPQIAVRVNRRTMDADYEPTKRWIKNAATAVLFGATAAAVWYRRKRLRAVGNLVSLAGASRPVLSGIANLVQTDDNLVISAPTASGKTVLIELAMCRLFENGQSRSRIPQTRALYLAPLKSLCVEKATDWQARFSACGLQCTKVIGGETAGTSESRSAANPLLTESHIICATPEKWISQMRDSRTDMAHTILQSIRLVLIDECHMIGSDRGAALEMAVTQIRYICSNPRFVATSATIGNISDIARWLSQPCSNNSIEPSPAKTLVFGEEYRPVPLSKTVLGYTCNAPYYRFQRNLDFKLPGIINAHSPDKPVLIFCSTRGSAQDTCRFLSRNIDQLSCRPTPMYLSSKFTNSILNETVPLGVAYHHAGLSSGDRQRIESLFSSGSIRILCSTSTLGIGVNLPAYAVIVKGTKGYAEGDYTEYSMSEILQFVGRAGRPQFGSSGKAVILTDSTMVGKYQAMVSGQDVLESKDTLTVSVLGKCRELAAQCSETVPAVLQQIEGIGPRYAATLWKLGIRSISALLNMTTRDIEYHLGRNPPFGTHVITGAKLLPACSEEPMLLLRFEQLELSSEGAFFETQIGLCNPVPRSTVVVDVAPESFVGCCEQIEIEIPDYDCTETDAHPEIDLDMYDEYLEELLASDAKDMPTGSFE